MDYFEEQEAKRKAQKTKEQYKKGVLKVLNILSLVFGILGIVFLVVGFVFLFGYNIFELYLPFLILGGVYLLVVLILNIILRSVNYDGLFDRYQNRVGSGKMIYTTSEMSARILMLEERVKNLEEEVESLKKNR